MSRKIRYGMIGGGHGAFIGAVHRIAAAMDQQIELVCGAFSSDPERSKASGADLFLPAERCYGTFEEMIQKEKARPADGPDQIRGWWLCRRHRHPCRESGGVHHRPEDQ